MAPRDDYGYLTNPTNGLGIVRARTLLGNLRLWDVPRSEKALETVVQEIVYCSEQGVGNAQLPGLYFLFDDEHGEKKVYIGQTENIRSRITTHINSPENKIKNWKRVIIINDGRNTSQSDLNDENIRLVLENYLVTLLKINKYTVTTTASRTPSLSATQKTLCDSFKAELNILLTNKNKISKLITERADDEVYIDEVKKILKKKNISINKWGKIEAVINGKKTFIRPGSPKNKGWQVTFRGGKSSSFKTHLAAGDGFLLMPRGPVLLIPLESINKFVSSIDQEAFKRDTIDVFIRFDEDKIEIVYKGHEQIITEYAVNAYLK